MLGVMSETFEDEEASMSGVEDFFSVARTMPLAALMPSEVTPWLTALRAYSVEHVRRFEGSVNIFGHPYQSAPAYRCSLVSTARIVFLAIETYLGEKVVSEKEYLSAMLGLLLLAGFRFGQSGVAVLVYGSSV